MNNGHVIGTEGEVFSLFQSIPILRTFCFYASAGVLFLYLFVITFFVGYDEFQTLWIALTLMSMCLDESRLDQRKINSCSKPKPDSWVPNKFSQKQLGKAFFAKFVAPTLSRWPVKV